MTSDESKEREGGREGGRERERERERKRERERESERERGGRSHAVTQTYNFLAVVTLSYVLVVGDEECVWDLLAALECLVDPEGPAAPHLLVVGAEDGRVRDTISHLQPRAVVGNSIGTLLVVVLITT